MIRRSDAVTAASRGLLQYARICGALRAFLVPNGIAEEFLRVRDGAGLRNKLGLEHNDVVVGYIGSVDFWLDIRSLLKGMAIAKKRLPRLRGLIEGKGLHNQVFANSVTKSIAEEGLQHDITRIGFIPHQEVPKYMAMLSVGTIPFNIKNPTAYYAAPNKLWEYLSQKNQ